MDKDKTVKHEWEIVVSGPVRTYQCKCCNLVKIEAGFLGTTGFYYQGKKIRGRNCNESVQKFLSRLAAV